MKYKIITMMLLTTGLIACSEPQSNTDQVKANEKNNSKEHILSEQERMIQKAKNAEKLIKEADEKRRKAIKDQGG